MTVSTVEKITISVPSDLAGWVRQTAPGGNVSAFVTSQLQQARRDAELAVALAAYAKDAAASGEHEDWRALVEADQDVRDAA